MGQVLKNLHFYDVKKSESLLDFYAYFTANRPDVKIPPLDAVSNTGHFNVFKRVGKCSLNPTPYNRRDFYKISLIIGDGILHYPDKQIEIKGSGLLFTNPNIPYSWEATSDEQSGYFCLFTENFIHYSNERIHESLLTKINKNPVFHINAEQQHCISELFVKMMNEIDSDYIYKYDLIRHYVSLIVHEAIRMQPVYALSRSSNAASRISGLFFELLERQFPIGSPEHILNMRNAHDYAEKLSVHVNHLNHAVKEVTGKTTSEHIAKRIANEAISLLKHTDWNISEIAYCLGFEYPANFNIFFKRQTTATPRSFRERKAM